MIRYTWQFLSNTHTHTHTHIHMHVQYVTHVYCILDTSI